MSGICRQYTFDRYLISLWIPVEGIRIHKSYDAHSLRNTRGLFDNLKSLTAPSALLTSYCGMNTASFRHLFLVLRQVE